MGQFEHQISIKTFNYINYKLFSIDNFYVLSFFKEYVLINKNNIPMEDKSAISGYLSLYIGK
jgi:hypothetical protein